MRAPLELQALFEALAAGQIPGLEDARSANAHRESALVQHPLAVLHRRRQSIQRLLAIAVGPPQPRLLHVDGLRNRVLDNPAPLRPDHRAVGILKRQAAEGFLPRPAKLRLHEQLRTEVVQTARLRAQIVHLAALRAMQTDRPEDSHGHEAIHPVPGIGALHAAGVQPLAGERRRALGQTRRHGDGRQKHHAQRVAALAQTLRREDVGHEHVVRRADLQSIQEHATAGVQPVEFDSRVLPCLGRVKLALVGPVPLFHPLGFLGVVSPEELLQRAVAQQIGVHAAWHAPLKGDAPAVGRKALAAPRSVQRQFQSFSSFMQTDAPLFDASAKLIFSRWRAAARSRTGR